MTLVELLISIAILGTLVGGIASIFYVARRAQDQASSQFAENDDFALASIYFQRDVHSATANEQNSPGNCAGQTAALVLTWTDESTGFAYESDYVLAPPRKVLRSVCRNEGEGWEVLVENTLATGATSLSVEGLTGANDRPGLRLSVTTEDGEVLRMVAYQRTG